jgi:hypothetical protein
MVAGEATGEVTGEASADVIDLPTNWPSRVEARLLRQVLAEQGYDLVQRVVGGLTEFQREQLEWERKAFVRSAVVTFAAQFKLATEDELVAEAQKLWQALQKAGC